MTGSVKSEPRVGIFWLLRDRLIVDTSLLSEAEAGGDWLNHARGHYDYWTRQQRQKLVPHDVEFEEPPRGRCVFNVKTKRFTLYADRCILKRKSVVIQIMKAMCLPARQTDVTTDGHDGHYRCARCMAASSDHHDDQ